MRKVAAFDFDGTLAKGDSLLPFLLRLLGGPRVARSVFAHLPAFGMIGIGKGNRDVTKERFIAHTLAGHPIDEIHSLGKEFAGWLITNRLLQQSVERLKWHQSEGHELVLVSAAIDVYLNPLAEQLSIGKVLCTRLDVENGHATGKLIGGNVRGPEKAQQLKRYLGTESEVELWAYGNSAGDHELLEMSDHPYYVKRNGQIIDWTKGMSS